MRKLPPRERPRRGARWGSRWATVLVAACLATTGISLSLPASAGAFGCGSASRPAQTLPPRQLQASQKVVPGDDCTTPGDRMRQQTSKRKRGSMSGLTVFVIAVAAALLIPIGRNGIPRAGDPFGHDRSFPGEER
jgi:hypothetical protein